MEPISLYLHIPFCRHKCSYCDFNTYAGMESRVDPYVRALCREIALFSASSSERLAIQTVFFGGGTPSLLTVAQLDSILKAVRSAFDLQRTAEVTLEANPGTLSPGFVEQLRRLGVNRLSIGMQTSNPAELRLLEREHGHPEVIEAVFRSRQAGFQNLNLDLIFGLPAQTLESWQRTLRRALELAPEHFSLYALTLEHGTPLQSWVERGLVELPDPDLAAEMYEWAADHLAAAGYLQYEISNWAKADDARDLRCQHNLQYWRNLPYIGLGAGAHGYLAGYRTANVRGPQAYIERCRLGEARPYPRTPATSTAEAVDPRVQMSDTMLMGLRLTEEGISEARFSGQFSTDLMEVFGAEVERLLQNELLEWAGENVRVLRLTHRGRLLGNQVFRAFV